jgi:hypothetical protein
MAVWPKIQIFNLILGKVMVRKIYVVAGLVGEEDVTIIKAAELFSDYGTVLCFFIVSNLKEELLCDVIVPFGEFSAEDVVALFYFTIKMF